MADGREKVPYPSGAAMPHGSLFLTVLSLAGMFSSGALGFVDNSQIEPDIYQLQRNMTTMMVEMAQLRNTVTTLQQELNNTAALAAIAAANPHSPPVAFTAHLSTTIGTLALHAHVNFDKVITNVGGAYNSGTGHFTAPAFGLYFFSVTATNTPGHSVSLSLMKNGQWQALTLAHGTDQTPGQWETSTMVAVLSLVAGDQVWAQNEGQFSPVESLDGYNYSSFTGYLLYKL